MPKHSKVFWIILVVFMLVTVGVIAVSNYIPFFEIYGMKIVCFLLGGFLLCAAFEAGRLISDEDRTDGDLIAGLEDEDGLVIALNIPVEEIKKKSSVRFNIVHKQMEIKKGADLL